MSARRPVLVLAAIAVILAAYPLYWFHACGQMRNHLLLWAEQRRAAGWQVEWRDMAETGFPWRLSLSLEQPRIATPAGVSWQAERLTLWATPPWPRALHLATGGRQHLAWPGGNSDFSLDSLAATIGRGTLDAHLHGLSLDKGVKVADLGLAVAALAPTASATSATSAAPTAAAASGGHAATWRFAVSAHEIGLPTPPLAGLEGRLVLAEISGRVMGAVPDAPPLAAIAGWSRQGGVLELDHLALDWPPLGLEGDGTAALDPGGQPLVALSARLRGLDGLMDRLAGQGGLDPAAARTAKTILSLMAKPDSRGRPAVAAPLSIQDGQLYLGPARLVAVPSLPWADFSAP